jgi:cell division protein FtsQ
MTPSRTRADHAAPVTSRRAPRPPRRRVRTLTKVLLITGVVVTALVLGGQWLLRQPYFRVQHIAIVGVHHESSTAVEQASGLLSHPSMLDVSAATVESNLSAFPWIKSVQLTKHWPNTVDLTVHESVAVAVAFSNKHVLEFVSESGRELGPAPLKENLPTLEAPVIKTSIWQYQGTAKGAAYVASQLPKAFSSQVSIISDDAQGDVSMKLTTPVTFLLGPPTNLHQKFVAIASVIAHSTLVPGDVVDVTVPDEVAVTPPKSS